MYWIDVDGDWLGDGQGQVFCDEDITTTSGYVLNNADCDDTVFCLSNNCTDVWYDSDGDGFGAGDVDVQCLQTIDPNWVLNSDDLDDACTSNEYANYCVDGDGDDHSDAITSTGICTDHADNYFASGSDCGMDTDDSIYCLSNTFNTYYQDNDGDDLGGELADAYLCSDDADSTWELNSDDLDDSCTSNDYQTGIQMQIVMVLVAAYLMQEYVQILQK